MKSLRRYFRPNCLCFLTHITDKRLSILVDNIDLWEKAIASTQRAHPFDLVAWAVLPDHLHLLIDCQSQSVSSLMKRAKMSFAEQLRNRDEIGGPVWQHRFWDHLIRDSLDLETHLHYIHFNPVKHRLVTRPGDFPYSSFSWFVANGFYEDDWGVAKAPEFDGEFGE